MRVKVSVPAQDTNPWALRMVGGKPGPVLERSIVIATIISNGYTRRGIAIRGLCPQEHRIYASVLLGKAGEVALLDEREGIDREGGVLTYEPVHGCLARAERAARKCVPLTRPVVQACGKLVR
jgi:hypothetical protein